MTEWQDIKDPEPENPEFSPRARWLIMLGSALEQIEEKFIMGNIDRDEYNAQLQDLDAKLAIVGLTLVNKPKGANRV
jgi:hypothetical protein